MVSRNQLLNGPKVKEVKAKKIKVNAELGWPKRLYHVNFLSGKVYQTLPEQEEAKEEGWVESPADIEKVKKVKGSKTKTGSK